MKIIRILPLFFLFNCFTSFTPCLPFDDFFHLDKSIEMTGVESLGAVAVGSDGSFYIGDKSAHQIHIFDSKGNPVLSFGEKGPEKDQFGYIMALAVDEEQELIYASNFSQSYGWISVFDFEGKFKNTISPAPAFIPGFMRVLEGRLYTGLRADPPITVFENGKQVQRLTLEDEASDYPSDSFFPMDVSGGTITAIRSAPYQIYAMKRDGTPIWKKSAYSVFVKAPALDVNFEQSWDHLAWGDSFTRVSSCWILGDYLLARQLTGKHNSAKYALDIFDMETGDLVVKNVFSKFSPRARDDKGGLYFYEKREGRHFLHRYTLNTKKLDAMERIVLPTKLQLPESVESENQGSADSAQAKKSTKPVTLAKVQIEKTSCEPFQPGSIKLPDFKGNAIDITRLGGRLNLLVFFTPEVCLAGLNERKYWAELAEAYEKTDLSMVGILLGSDLETAQSLTDYLELPFPVVWDENRETKKLFGLRHYPSKIGLDKNGKTVFISAPALYDEDQKRIIDDVKALLPQLPE